MSNEIEETETELLIEEEPVRGSIQLDKSNLDPQPEARCAPEANGKMNRLTGRAPHRANADRRITL
jgi:hypothetical protein